MSETTEKLLDSINETARITRTALLLLLVVALYLLIIVGTTTDLMLLRGEIVALPLMEVGVPVVAFYIAAPLIFLLLHINLLLRLSQLAETIRRWRANSKGLEDERSALVFPLDFARLLLKGKSRWVLWAVVVIQIVLLPIVVLLALQMSFLAYQNSDITAWHQIIVTIDLVSLFLFVFSIRGALAERKSNLYDVLKMFFQGQKKTFFGMKIGRNNVLKMLFQMWEKVFLAIFVLISVISALIIAGFTWTIAVVPNIEQEMVITEKEQLLVTKMMKMNPDDFCFPVDGSQERSIQQQLSACIFADWWRGYPLTAYRPFRRYLKLVEQPIALKEAPPEIVDTLIRQTGEPSPDIPCQHIGELDLSGRQLNYARFDRAQFHCVNLEEAKLHGAYLLGAKLHDANLSDAELHGAYLLGAKLHGANLYYAKLHGADLQLTELYGADLRSAELHGAGLSWAKLHGADLRSAELHGANLYGAELHGANLSRADLHGANLSDAELHGANLIGVWLYGADLGEAILENTDLSGVRWDRPEDWDTIKDNISKTLRKRKLTDARINNGLSQIQEIATDGFSPPATPSADDCVLHSGEGPFEGWPEPATECDSEFISSVVQVACRNQWTAKSIVSSAIFDEDIDLINALLMKNCSVLYSYREILSDVLKELN